MKTTYVDPLIPLHESSGETLTRLSANIATLTGLIIDSEHRGLIYLAGMFSHSRATKIEQARALIALLTASDKAGSEPRVRSLAPEFSDWQEAGTELQIVGDLIHAGADRFAAERRFLLVGRPAPERSARDLPYRGIYRPQRPLALPQ